MSQRTVLCALTTASLLMVLAPASRAIDIVWTNGTASYNSATRWSPNQIPGAADNAINNNGTNNVVQINGGDPDWSVTDIIAGNDTNATVSGAFEQNGQTVSVGGWLRLGLTTNSFGMYTLNAGTLNVLGGRIMTGEAEGSSATIVINGGVLNKTGDFFILADAGFGAPHNASASMIQNGGTINSSSEIWIGQGAGGVGLYELHAGGAVNSSNWFVVGRAGATGTMNMDGGSILHVSGGTPAFIVGDGGMGTLNHSGGTIATTGAEFWIGNGGAGLGTNNMSGTAVLNVNNWFAVGRGGIGELNLSGGAVTKTGGGNVVLGAFGGSSGVINQSGGTFTNTTSQTWIGETTAGQWTITGGIATLGVVHLAQNNGSSGILNLDGGLFHASEITTGNAGGFSTLNFNGGTLKPTANNANFLHDLTQALVQSGGAVFDTDGFDITVAQALFDAGFGGGLTKNGAGALTLTGGNNYSGPTAVNAGKLSLTTASSGAGSITVANGAAFEVVVASANAQIFPANLTLGTSAGTTLEFDLGAFGNPFFAPISVGNNLAVNGTVTVNIEDDLPQVGQFPLISYASRSGVGNFMIGSLPTGVGASISNNLANNSIDLVITNVNVVRWDGQVNGNWDIGVTTNWVNAGTLQPSVYNDGNPAIFNDDALGATTINLTTTVSPNGVTAAHSSLNYTFTGSGRISGPQGLTKEGTGSLTIHNTGGNNYTGPTVINGGTLSVTNLANGGSASAIGASSASSTNLILGAGTLRYSGPSVSINRGYSVQGTNSTIDVQGNLTLSGIVTATVASASIKTGPATLTYATAGVNNHSGSGSTGGYEVTQGAVVFDGTSGGQTNNIIGPVRLASVAGMNASVTLSNSTLNVPGSPFNVGQATGSTGTLNIVNGVINKQGGGGGNALAFGNANGFGIGNQSGGTINSSSEFWVGNRNNNATNTGAGAYTLSGGTMNISNWVAIGRFGGNGTFTMTGGAFNKRGGGEFLIGAGGNSIGVLNHGGGTIDSANQFLVPENGNTSTLGTYNVSNSAVFLARSWVAIGRGGAAGVMNMSGGTFAKVADAGSSLIIAADGPGTLTQTGGTISNTLSQTWVGENNTGAWTMSNGEAILGFLQFGRNGSGVGTLHFNGGTISATEIAGGAGLATNNLNGGTIKARANMVDFMHDLDAANVLSNGVTIDTDTFTIGISQPLLNGGGNGGLTKVGSGTLNLNGVNTYTGTTLVSAGTLGGTGTIAGPVSVAAGGTLAPATSVGTLTINNTLTLNGTTIMEISRDSGSPQSDRVSGITTLTYGGTLVVTNIGTNALQVGDTFQLFSAAIFNPATFAAISLPAGYTWNTDQLGVNGTISVSSVAPVVQFNPPVVSGGNLILSGGGGATGGTYYLRASTNVALSVTSWTRVATNMFDGSGNFSLTNAINPAVPRQFYLIEIP